MSDQNIDENARRRRVRNYVLAGVLCAIVVLLFIVTLTKLQGP